MKNRTRLILSILIWSLFVSSANAVAGVVAIVNKANTYADKKTIGRLYTLEIKAWPDGSRAILYESSSESVRNEFCNTYTGKSADIIETDLAKAVFVGRSKPHKIFKSDADIVEEVSKEKDAVGYVNESSLKDSVRAVR